MIIKELQIKNFRSYYGENNRFKFSDGLTLIIGDNGDGKTTFFEALQWLFNTTTEKGSLDHVSEMRKSKLEIGESDEVKVSMIFDHDGEKSVEKSFTFERTGEDTFKIGSLIYRGYETSNSERISVNGKILINRCYDAFIQRFSMFKGESELNVFDSPTALKDLVDKFSDIRKFDKLEEYSASFAEKANTAYLKQIKSDEKVSKEASSLELRIKRKTEEIFQTKNDIKEKNHSLELFTTKLSQLEQSKETSEQYKDISNQLKSKQDDANRLKAKISLVDYNHSLLDRFWILAAFPPILKEFQKKCSALSKEKRVQEREFVKQQAAAKAKLETIKELQGALINGATELPWYLPDQETMEDMLHDHICKVCGRPAPEDSDAYKFMQRKLEDYKKHAEAKLKKEAAEKEIDEKSLFKNHYIEELHNMSVQLSGIEESKISAIAGEIKDRIELVARFTNDLNTLNEKIRDITDEKSRLLIQAGNIPESVLEAQFNDIRGLFEQKERTSIRLTELTNDLSKLNGEMKDLQESLDSLSPSSIQVKTMREVYRTLDVISKAFSKAKKENLRRFLYDLQERANDYLEELSANDFHGEIRLIQTADDSTEIRLYSSNNTEIKKPSGSQKTVMYISVLFAISDFTKQKRDEDYPLIFDAATSSFGDSKEKEFYNVIDKLSKQCIIVTKDFISEGKVRQKDIEGLTCSVYRIQKASGFDQRNMATIRTTIENLK